MRLHALASEERADLVRESAAREIPVEDYGSRVVRLGRLIDLARRAHVRSLELAARVGSDR